MIRTRFFLALVAVLTLSSSVVVTSESSPQMIGPRDSLPGHDGRELNHNLILPQLAVGQSYTTTIVLLNLGDPDRMGWISRDRLQARGKIIFYRQDGTRFPVSVNRSAPASEFSFSLDASKSTAFEVSASGQDTSGWALIEVEDDDDSGWGRMDDYDLHRGGKLMATTFYTHNSGGNTLSRVGVVPSLYETLRFLNFVVPATQDTGISTGVAIVNAGLSSATVNLRLRDFDGSTVASSSLRLPPGNQIARFVDQLFSNTVPARFQGILEVSSNEEGVVMLGLLVSQGILTSIPTFHYGSMMRW